MRTPGGGFRLEGELRANLEGFDDHARKGVIAAANYIAPQAESYMKTGAKWTDRSGAARNGLKSQVVTSGNKTAIVLYHTVPYGVWLEIRWAGKYSIIDPTIEAMLPKFMEAVERLVFSKFGGL